LFSCDVFAEQHRVVFEVYSQLVDKLVPEVTLKYLVVEAVALMSFLLVDAEDVIIIAVVPKVLVSNVVGGVIFIKHGRVVVGDVGGRSESWSVVSSVTYFGGG
jgi:hypothetical protein